MARLPPVQRRAPAVRPSLQRPDRLGGDSDASPSPPAAGQDGAQEHEVQELLVLKVRCGRPYVLVHWMGPDTSGKFSSDSCQCLCTSGILGEAMQQFQMLFSGLSMLYSKN